MLARCARTNGARELGWWSCEMVPSDCYREEIQQSHLIHCRSASKKWRHLPASAIKLRRIGFKLTPGRWPLHQFMAHIPCWDYDRIWHMAPIFVVQMVQEVPSCDSEANRLSVSFWRCAV